ncbi:MAG: ABC-type transport auxiliary lipoprotein family protein [Pseudomonadota bacterium]|mgnify:CR=1 FL=1
MTTFTRWAGQGIFAALALVLLAGCAQPELPIDHFYRLQVAMPQPAGRTLKGTIEVNRFTADGLVAGRPIVYTEPDQPHQVREYNYHFWTEPPTIMLRDQLVAHLRAAKIAETVTTPDMRANADFILTGRIIRLEKIEGAAPQGALEIELGVRAAAGKIILLEVYKFEVAAENNTVEAAVRALNKALDQAYAQFIADLTRK